MRRAALAEISRELRGRDQRGVTLLDVACGNGRFLEQVMGVWPRLKAAGLDLSPNYAEAARAKTETFLAVLDGHLAGRDYLVGDTFTMADIPVGATACRWYAMPIGREPHPNIERWLAKLRERPGFRQHIDLPLS